MTAHTIPTRPGRIFTAGRALRVCFLRAQARGVADERHEYERSGGVGPVYLLNSLNEQMQYLREARRIELGN